MQIELANEKKYRELLLSLSNEEIKERIGIGFCQQKFWKRSAWRQSMKMMEVVCSLGLAEPFDFGRGKGKYISDFDISEVVAKVIAFRDSCATRM